MVIVMTNKNITIIYYTYYYYTFRNKKKCIVVDNKSHANILLTEN